MRITVNQLRKIISEEVSRLLEEKPKAASPSMQFKKRKVGFIEKPKESKKKDDKKTPVKESAEKKKSLVESIMAITDEEKAQWSRGNYSFIADAASKRAKELRGKKLKENTGGVSALDDGFCPQCGTEGEEPSTCRVCAEGDPCPMCGQFNPSGTTEDCDNCHGLDFDEEEDEDFDV